MIETDNNSAALMLKEKYGHVLTGKRPPGPAEGMRIASYQLVEYLERLGVEVVFGLCGHTVIALLDALGKSKQDPVHHHAPRTGRSTCCRRLRPSLRQARHLDVAPGAWSY